MRNYASLPRKLANVRRAGSHPLRQDQQPSSELARDIFTFLRSHLATFKRIRRIEFSELPKTISGKIRRVELRKMEADRRSKGEKVGLEYFEEDFPI